METHYLVAMATQCWVVMVINFLFAMETHCLVALDTHLIVMETRC